jgi:uncharacterized membrane protein YgcG
MYVFFMDEALEKHIWEELKAIRLELAYIKEHMVDADTLLTSEEEELLEESLKEFEKGEATRLEDFENEVKG